MKTRLIVGTFLLFCMLSSCNSNAKQEAPKSDEAPKTTIVREVSKPEEPYKDLVFDDKNDFVCGMPVTAGVSDTAHYKEKLYGFCSKECKEAFLKEPDTYVKVEKTTKQKN
jgi:YHS domain-containing protein